MCATDWQPLVACDPSGAPKVKTFETREERPADPDSPEQRWSASDAWKCIGMLLVMELVFGLVLLAAESAVPGFRMWRWRGFGYFSTATLRYGIFLLVAAYFAHTETPASVWHGFSLDVPPSEAVWFGIVCALGLRAFGHFLIVEGLGRGVSNFDLHAFRQAVGSERFWFLGPLMLLAPVIEEAVNRGFLYRAFRGSLPRQLSVFLMVGWTAITHWSYYSQSWVAAVDLSALTVVQCYLREESNSLWDCILCHFAFNASLLFVGGMLR